MTEDRDNKPKQPQQPKQQQQQQQNPDPDFEYKAGDDTCSSCTGVLFYSKAMREKGQRPLCVGARTTLKYRVSMDTMKKIDEKQAKKQAEEIYMCIGYARMSGRMERKGQTPSCIDGIAISRYPDLPNQAQTDQQKAPQVAPVPTPVGAPVPVPPFALPLPSLQAVDDFAVRFQKSAVRNVDVVSKFWQRSLTDFPEKFERSATRMATSMAGTPSRIGRAVSKVCGLLFGDDEDA